VYITHVETEIIQYHVVVIKDYTLPFILNFNDVLVLYIHSFHCVFRYILYLTRHNK
jgi:hypothetical protein